MFHHAQSGGTVTLGTAVYGNSDDMAATSVFNDGKWHNYVGLMTILREAASYIDGYWSRGERQRFLYLGHNVSPCDGPKTNRRATTSPATTTARFTTCAFTPLR